MYRIRNNQWLACFFRSFFKVAALKLENLRIDSKHFVSVHTRLPRLSSQENDQIYVFEGFLFIFFIKDRDVFKILVAAIIQFLLENTKLIVFGGDIDKPQLNLGLTAEDYPWAQGII